MTTDWDAGRLEEAKAEVTEWLRGDDVTAVLPLLRGVDVRIADYVVGVAGAPQAHNLWEQLAVRRFVRHVGEYGLDAAAVRRFFYLYEHLYFPGTGGMTQYKLTPVQAFQFGAIYGLKSPAGGRLVREAVLFVPRKFSKTTSSAAIAVNDLLYGEANAEAYTGANSQDQAKKCFDVIRGCMFRLDPEGKRYVVNEEIIKSRRKDRSAIAQCLTANARTKDGLNASTVIMDEYSQARDDRLYTVLTTSMGIRAHPLTVIITTASDVFEGPFYAMLKGYKAMLLGDVEDDPTVFCHLFQPDVGDVEGDPATWRKVQPHMGVTVSEEFYRREWAAAQRNGSGAMMAFKTKLLNVYCADEQRSWIGRQWLERAMRPIDIKAYGKRYEAMLGVDLSESGDLTAVSCCVCTKHQESYEFHTAYFFPQGALDGHPEEQLFRDWAAAGHLKLLPGAVIDYGAIVEYILGLNTYVRIIGIGFDPWKSTDMFNRLRASTVGVDSVLHGIPQHFGNFTAPCEAFEHGIKTGHIVIDDNPINAYCFANAKLSVDLMENCKPTKRQSDRRIDGVITKLMCLRQFIDRAR